MGGKERGTSFFVFHGWNHWKLSKFNKSRICHKGKLEN